MPRAFDDISVRIIYLFKIRRPLHSLTKLISRNSHKRISVFFHLEIRTWGIRSKEK